MKMEKSKWTATEQAMREAFLRQVTPLPDEAWYGAVMERVRNEAAGSDIPWGRYGRIAWRSGWITAAAALLVALLGISQATRENQLVWDYQKSGALVAWVADFEE